MVLGGRAGVDHRASWRSRCSCCSREVGIVNTYLAVFLPSIVSPFGVYLARIFATAAAPQETHRVGARLDGAGEFRTFFSVVVQADVARRW